MAFIVAGFIVLATILIAGFMLFAAGMSDSPSAANSTEESAKYLFTVGMVIAVLVGLSHWVSSLHLPHMNW